MWPLPTTGSSEVRTLDSNGLFCRIVPDPQGRYVLAAGYKGIARLLPLDGAPPRTLKGFSEEALLDAAAVSPSGRRVATAPSISPADEKVIRVWDLHSGDATTPDLLGKSEAGTMLAGKARGSYGDGGILSMAFVGESTLYTAGTAGLVRWDLEDGSAETLVAPDPGWTMYVEVSADGRTALSLTFKWEDVSDCRTPRLHDLVDGVSRPLSGFGKCVANIALDSSGRIVATGDLQGAIRVGRIDGSPPHVLVGHDGVIKQLAISPDGRWVASSGEDNTLRLWPMPDLDATPLHALPHDELIAKLESLTNLRAVRDPEAPAGWSIELGPFPGWRDAPKW
jgi:WD40 repeat protein